MKEGGFSRRDFLAGSALVIAVGKNLRHAEAASSKIRHSAEATGLNPTIQKSVDTPRAPQLLDLNDSGIKEYIEEKTDERVANEIQKETPEMQRRMCNNFGLIQGNPKFHKDMRWIGPREAAVCKDKAKIDIKPGSIHDNEQWPLK